jgi:hypothetical protein
MLATVVGDLGDLRVSGGGSSWLCGHWYVHLHDHDHLHDYDYDYVYVHDGGGRLWRFGRKWGFDRGARWVRAHGGRGGL